MQTLSERLSLAMKHREVKAIQLAQAIGVSGPSVSDWITGKSKSIEGKNLIRAARFLGVSPEWLALGESDFEESRRDPLQVAHDHRQLQWEQVPVANEILNRADEPALPVIKAAWPATRGSFALKLQAGALLPVFSEECILFAQTDSKPKQGSLVIASLLPGDACILRRWVKEGGETLLKPLNPQHPSSTVTTEAVIHAVISRIEINLLKA